MLGPERKSHVLSVFRVIRRMLAGTGNVARSFLLAACFLTRLPSPPRMHAAPCANADALSAAALYYPLVGALLGALLCLPLWLGFFAQQPWVQAWLYILLSAWLTRALHLDGLADLSDALGSGKSGPAFRAVLKDSRIGAFGVISLVLALSGQLVLCASLLQAERIPPLFFAPLYGRCLPILFACLNTPYADTGLGALLAKTAKAPALALAVLCALCFGALCLPWPSLLLCLALSALLLAFLTRLARREGGYNGDFLGFCIVAGENLALLAAVAG